MHQDPTYLGYVPTTGGKPTLVFDNGFLVQWDRKPELCGWYAYKNHHQIAANVDRDLVVNLIAFHPTSGLVGQIMAKVRDAMATESSETRTASEVSDLSQAHGASVASDRFSSAGAHPARVSDEDGDSDGDSDSRVDSFSRGHSDTENDTGNETGSETDSVSEAAPVPHTAEVPGHWDPKGQFLLFDTVDAEMYLPSPIYAFASALVWVGGRHPLAFDEKHALAAVGGFDGSGKPIHKKALAVRTDLVRFG